MALLQWNFMSSCLKGNTEIKVILPDMPYSSSPKEFYSSGKKYKVLYLLHGTYGDSSDWIRKSNIELYACERDLIVVMPSAMNTNYANWPNFGIGYDMYDFLTEELMPMISGWLPVYGKREDTYIAGLSMGGRGALVYALNHPELFAGAAVLSSCPLDMDWLKDNNKGMYDRFMNEFNVNNGGIEGWRGTPGDVMPLLEKLNGTGLLPKLYFASGKADPLYPNFKHFRELAEAKKLDVVFEERDGYKHEWRFWDMMIEKALDFFEIERR